MSRPLRSLLAGLFLLSLAACAGDAPQENLAAEAPPSPYMAATAEAGETVVTQPGDTVYSVARRYKVSMRDVIALNNLQPPFALTAGSPLVLPAKEIMMAPRKEAAVEKRMPVAANVPTEPQSIIEPVGDPGVTTYHQVAENADGTPQEGSEKVLYEPKHQEAMQSLARDSLQRPPPGPVPVRQTDPIFIPASPQAQAAPPPEPVFQPLPQAQLQPPVLQKKPLLQPAVMQGPGRFIWPVHGKVLAEFGSQSGGQRNDGINISAPRGTPVAASDGGTVAYAGSDIPGYGNVVLIRHPDGYMTTYAHLERIFVARDSVTAKGDVIGTVGTTGGLVTPQLHFEIRKGADALPPKRYLAKS